MENFYTDLSHFSRQRIVLASKSANMRLGCNIEKSAKKSCKGFSNFTMLQLFACFYATSWTICLCLGLCQFVCYLSFSWFCRVCLSVCLCVCLTLNLKPDLSAPVSLTICKIQFWPVSLVCLHRSFLLVTFCGKYVIVIHAERTACIRDPKKFATISCS